jgi:hypothetical protein
VLLKLGEITQCATRNQDCSFEFVQPEATVTGLTSSWDESANRYLVTLAGSGF